MEETVATTVVDTNTKRRKGGRSFASPFLYILRTPFFYAINRKDLNQSYKGRCYASARHHGERT